MNGQSIAFEEVPFADGSMPSEHQVSLDNYREVRFYDCHVAFQACLTPLTTARAVLMLPRNDEIVYYRGYYPGNGSLPDDTQNLIFDAIGCSVRH